MAELSTIARPYAEALFKACQGKELASWSQRLNDLASITAHPEVQAIAQDPKVGVDKLFGLVAGLLKTPLPAEGQNFLRAVVENGRLQAVPEMALQFAALKNSAEKSADAVISTPFELSGAALNELVASLEKKFGVKINPIVKKDESLIGGVSVQLGDQVLDGSVKAQLEALRQTLRA
jgi:F-type H+-transporting ATPase subunit delta